MSETHSEETKRDLAEHAMRHSWFPVARSVDVTDKPYPTVLLKVPLVVWRGADGVAHVQSRRCPHRGADLSQGRVHANSIGCPYHGWEFNGGGVCSRIPSLEDQSKIPANAKIPNYPAVERFGHVWTVLEDPAVPLYDPVEWKDKELEWMAAPILDSPVGVGVSIENFRDVAHFPFVHFVSMGPSPEVVEPLDVKRDGVDVWMYRPLDAGEGEWANDGDCMMKYHCIAPGFASITYEYEKLGTRVVVGFPSPMSYEHVQIFWGVANSKQYKGLSLAENLHIEEVVYREDLPIVEGLEPKEIPWDMEYEEFSVPADLFTLNYRRAFGELMRRVKENDYNADDNLARS